MTKFFRMTKHMHMRHFQGKEENNVGYQKSMAAVTKVTGFLDSMLNSTSSITWSVKSDPDKVAMLIRQGIYAAKYQIKLSSNADPVLNRKLRDYSRLLNRFKLKVKNKFVIAELIVSETADSNVVDMFSTSVTSVVVNDPMRIEDIIQYLVKSEAPLKNVNKITFTNFEKSPILTDYKKFLSFCSDIAKFPNQEQSESTLTLSR